MPLPYRSARAYHKLLIYYRTQRGDFALAIQFNFDNSYPPANSMASMFPGKGQKFRPQPLSG